MMAIGKRVITRRRQEDVNDVRRTFDTPEKLKVAFLIKKKTNNKHLKQLLRNIVI